MPGKSKKRYKLLTIVVMGFITGTLQAIAIMIINQQSPEMAFKYIASGYYGREAYLGDQMVLWGVLFNYLIALAFSLALWAIYPKFRRGIKNKYTTGVIYGVLVWIIMTFAVLPLTNIAKNTDTTPVDKLFIIKNIVAMIICVGLPAALISDNYYMQKARRAARRRVRNHYS